MKAKSKYLVSVLLVAALLLSGCTAFSVDNMYQLPKRSDDYNILQSAIDKAMAGMEYCAPVSGENRQTVQMADLDGDMEQEYLLFAKSSDERPLRILVFDRVDEKFLHTITIESNGSAFDQIEYVQMDDGGVELVVGSQLNDQILRSVAVYKFYGGIAQQLMSANYTKFLSVDLDMDNRSELFILRPGQTEVDNGVAELYGMENGEMVRSNQVNMSRPPVQLKRILLGKLNDGEPAVYVASAMDETHLITDVYAYVDGVLSNVSFSNESGTSIKTMRDYYVYADDIDNDGVMELPALIAMVPMKQEDNADRHNLIRWYAMRADGSEVDKLYTYHNFVGGWYMDLQSAWASRVVVLRNANDYEFYIWNSNYESAQKVFTVYPLAGQNREVQPEQIVLHKSDSVTYCAILEDAASEFGIKQDTIVRAFHLIQQDWKTGET